MAIQTHFRIAIIAYLFLSGTVEAKERLIASSGRDRVQLIELYSSESCSSCPPADAWISSLQKRTGLWKKFVPIVFHVDYWNHLNWKDRFSSSEMTKRQVTLSRTWAEPSVYTPAMVVDGQEWRNWRSNGNFPSTESKNLELFLYQEDGGSYRIKANGLLPQKKYVIRMAQLGMELGTDVKSGENSGHHLKHNFLVLDWLEKSISQLNTESSFSFKEQKQKPLKMAVAAWIEEEGNPAPLQSTGGYL